MTKAIIHMIKALAEMIVISGHDKNHSGKALLVALADFVTQHQD